MADEPVVYTDGYREVRRVPSLADSPGGAPTRYSVRPVAEHQDLTRPEAGVLLPFQYDVVPEVGVRGLTNEACLAVVIDRLQAFQHGPFACDENAKALEHASRALLALEDRTKARKARGVEGQHVA